MLVFKNQTAPNPHSVVKDRQVDHRNMVLVRYAVLSFFYSGGTPE
jgi:hypothetical protein